jgi:polysaccharide biosynthesis protein PslF
MRTSNQPRRIRLAIVSPCPPRACPVATYTDELTRMLRTVAPHIAPSVWAIAPTGESTPADDAPPTAGGSPATGTIACDDPSAYRRAGLRLRRIGAAAALLQYGPGTAGGPHGRYLLSLTDELDRAHVPYLITLHGLHPSIRPDDADVIAALCRHAAGIIVLSHCARTALLHNRLVSPERVAIVAQGAPPELLRPQAADPGPAITRALASVARGPLLTTIGHLRPAKGIEVAMTALPLLAEHYPGVRYIVAGRTHDDHVHLSGQCYRETLVQVAEALGVADRLILLDTDPTPSELSALLHATDVYLAPDLDRGRTSGGSLGYALAAGRPVVAAANPFANEVVPARGSSVVPPGNPTALAAAAERLLTKPAQLPSRWPSSIATAEQIAGLVGLITGPSPHTGPPAHRRPRTLAPAARAEYPYPRRAAGERVRATLPGESSWPATRGGARSTSDTSDWTVAS